MSTYEWVQLRSCGARYFNAMPGQGNCATFGHAPNQDTAKRWTGCRGQWRPMYSCLASLLAYPSQQIQ